MKRNLLLNRIISFGLIVALYLSMSASAYADLEGGGELGPVVDEQAVEAAPEAPAETPATDGGSQEMAVENQARGTVTESEAPAAGTTTDSTQSGDATTAASSEGNQTPAEGQPAEGQPTEGQQAEGQTVENPEGGTLPEGSTDATTTPATAEDGTTTNPDGTVTNPDGIITNPDGEVTNPDETDTASTVATPEGETLENPDEALEELEEAEKEELTEEELAEKEARYNELKEKEANGEELTEEELAELEALEKELKIEKVEEEECEHELTYTPNKDGKHTVKCSKCEKFEEYIESCEFDEEGICIKCGYVRPKDPILVYEDDEIIVRVSGAIPENADLKVRPIKAGIDETKEAYQQIENTLNDQTQMNEAEEYGFLAYDISFIDIETSEEVEPDGDVTVTMEYKKAILPDSIGDTEDADTKVEMIHFKEDFDNLENLSEQGKADLSLDSGSAITQAEFVSDSFSTYVIKWTSNSRTRYVEIITTSYTRDNEELTEFSVDATELTYSTNTSNNPSTIILKDSFANTPIEGYRYVRAEYDDGTNIVEVDNFKFSQANSGKTKNLLICLGETQIASIAMTDSKDTMAHVNIAFIYEKDADLSITKKATGIAGADSETEYQFILMDQNGAPIANAQYFIGKTLKTTDGEGRFNLKSGESAYFVNASLPEGNYKIKEDCVVEGGAYTLDEFITKIIVDGNLEKTINLSSEDTREIQVTVTPGQLKDVVFKNYYTVHTSGESQPEYLYKYIKYNQATDDYQLGLKYIPPSKDEKDIIFEGEYNSSMEPTKVDIVLIIDKSGSMDDNNRMTHTKKAVKLLSKYFETKRSVDARWKIVFFAGTASLASNTQNWITSDQLSINVSPDGATNYESALNLANTQLGTGRADAKKIVLFLTDGEPTAYGNNQGERKKFDKYAYDLALTAASNMTCDAFYAIGVDFGSTKYTIEENGQDVRVTAKQILQRIAAKVNTNDATVVEVKSEEIVALFKNLAGNIVTTATEGFTEIETKNRASNIVITDTLSEYVRIKPKSDFYIALTIDGVDVWETSTYQTGHIDENGVMTTKATFDVEDNGTYQLEATYEDGVITLKFPENYQGNPDYEYYVSYSVIPSDYAYEEYIANGYNAVGGKDTDNKTVPEENWTSEGHEGFKSNSHAEVTRTYLGKREPIAFPHPVIQVHYKNVWEILKVNGEGIKLNGAEFRLQETGDIASAQSYTGTSALSGTTDGMLVWNLAENETIATDKVYKLTETKAPTGYVKSEDYWIITVSSENVPTVERFSADGVSQGIYEVTPTRERNVFTYRFEFLNVSVYTLPETGGNGIYTTTALGIAMMLTSTFLFYRNRRKQRVYAK